jgi:hypothetical protein
VGRNPREENALWLCVRKELNPELRQDEKSNSPQDPHVRPAKLRYTSPAQPTQVSHYIRQGETLNNSQRPSAIKKIDENVFEGHTLPEFIKWVHQSHPCDPYLNFILIKGVFLTKNDVTEYPLEIKIKKNGCYGNAQLATLATDEKLEYFEGYAVDKEEFFFPVEHAYNMFNGKIVDLTWKTGFQYCGIKIPLNFFETKLINHRKAVAMLKPYIDERLQQNSKTREK